MYALTARAYMGINISQQRHTNPSPVKPALHAHVYLSTWFRHVAKVLQLFRFSVALHQSGGGGGNSVGCDRWNISDPLRALAHLVIKDYTLDIALDCNTVIVSSSSWLLPQCTSSVSFVGHSQVNTQSPIA
jgi:hypothetical protein